MGLASSPIEQSGKYLPLWPSGHPTGKAESKACRLEATPEALPLKGREKGDGRSQPPSA